MKTRVGAREIREASYDEAVAADIASACSLRPLTARILASRGVDSPEAAERFLAPSLERDWRDPAEVPGLAGAADAIESAIRADKRILVFGDFDTDGVTATAISVMGLRELGARADGLIPHRWDEGYALSEKAVSRGVETFHPDVVMTVDCGISCADEVEWMLGEGLDVVVTDHHEPSGDVPRGVPVADPKLESGCPSRELCGAGVALKLLCLLGPRFGRPGLWRGYTDLAALGTIADIMELGVENRALVADGMQRIANSPRPGVSALLEVCKVDSSEVDATKMSFSVIPRINAAGRMGDATVAYDLLTCDDIGDASRLASELDEVNTARREAESTLGGQVRAAIEGDPGIAAAPVLIAAGRGWHEGVKGIVASRLAREYERPAIVFGIDDEGIARGSGRTWGDINLHELAGTAEDLYERFGGHAGAIGITIRADRLGELTERLCAQTELLEAGAAAGAIEVDAVADLVECDVGGFDEIARLAPFGEGNRVPLLALRGVFLDRRAPVGKQGRHFRFCATDGAESVDGIYFSPPDIDGLLGCTGLADVVFEASVDEWKGRRSPKLMTREIVVRGAGEGPDGGGDADGGDAVTSGGAATGGGTVTSGDAVISGDAVNSESITSESVTSESITSESIISGDAPSAGGSLTDTQRLVGELLSHQSEICDTGEYAGIERQASFHTKVVGVSFENRQETIATLESGVELALEREPDNEMDANAVAVRVSMSAHIGASGAKLGYLKSELAARLAPHMDAGVVWDAAITDVTGRDAVQGLSGDRRPGPLGVRDPGMPGRSLGVNIIVRRPDLEDAGDGSGSGADGDSGAAGGADGQQERFGAERGRWASVASSELGEKLREALIGENSLHDAQRETLENLKHGLSTLTVMATGRGKSLIFHLHAARTALLEGRASIFVYPLRALVADQAFHLQQTFSQFGLEVRVLNGETPLEERDEVYRGISEGTVDIVLTTPEFLCLHAGKFADTGRISFLVIDEAHHIGQAKAGNRPAYAELRDALGVLGEPLVLAVTATAGDEEARLITECLGIEKVVLDPTVRDNIRLDDRRDMRDRDRYIASLVARGEKCIVYVNSRDQSMTITRNLRNWVPDLAPRIAFYNAGLVKSDRKRIEGAFRSGELLAIVSTSAFGEGVDIPDIRHVVLYHLPFSPIEFNQMSGRVGRDGAECCVHLLYSHADARINEGILSSGAPVREALVALWRVLREESARALAAAGESGDAGGSGDAGDAGDSGNAGESGAAGDAGWFSVANASLAERAQKMLAAGVRIDEGGASTGIAVFRELGFLETSGRGPSRHIRMVEGPSHMELAQSARWREGCDQAAAFAEFKQWALSATADELLARINRPILPNL